MKTKSIGDIYPLTIIKMRYGDKYVIFNSDACNKVIYSVQEDEEISYDLTTFLEKKYSPLNYGIGKSIEEAFLDYQRREILI